MYESFVTEIVGLAQKKNLPWGDAAFILTQSKRLVS